MYLINKISAKLQESNHFLLLFGVFAALLIAALVTAQSILPYIKIEAENGSLSGNVTSASDNTASAGASLQFVESTSSGSIMQLVSRNVPLYTATNSTTKESLRDTSMPFGWESQSIPSWVTFDFSSLTAQQKQQIFLNIYAPRSQDYVVVTGASAQTPENYVVEVNSTVGGGGAPSSGWTPIATVTSNKLNTMQHSFSMTGQNWLRFRIVSAIGGGSSININMDVYSYAGSRPYDSWLFMGDSITAGAASYWTSDLQNRVAALDSGRWPAYISDGIGGTQTTSAASIIAGRLASFSGKYVVLGYGTNDGENGYQARMESLVQAVIAAGKTPVVPHMPWSNTKTGSTINQQIDNLYAQYPQILHGPDFWTIFLNRTDLIPSGDVHPTAAGNEVWRQSWANIMADQQ